MKHTAATVCRACQAPLAREATFCRACGAIVADRPAWESVPWWQATRETSTPAPQTAQSAGQEIAASAVDEDDQPTQELKKVAPAAPPAARRPALEPVDSGMGLAPRHLAAIVVIPILVFGASLLAASLLLKPSAPAQPAANGQRAAAASAAPTGSVLPRTTTPASQPPTNPTQAASPAGAQPTPFQLVPSPVRASGTFAQGAGGCPGFPGTQFTDQFTFSSSNGTLTLKQVSTGDVTSGPIQPDGSFAVKAADSSESYTGRISGLTATANYEHSKGSCKQTYVMSWRFQP